tara:strand:- start:195 stop:437 length:243 start_codon:yes stop_codon:yes gene_type:complete
MSRFLSDHIDEYCREKYSHSNWGYLNGYSKEDLSRAEHTIEGSIVFWENGMCEECDDDNPNWNNENDEYSYLCNKCKEEN